MIRSGGGGEDAARPGLFQVFLGLEPNLAAHHAAWEFALANNGGTLEALSKRWGVVIGHREHMRQLVRDERAITGAAFAEDAERFARELARRYFSVVGKSLRAADPAHLVLGCRFATAPTAGVAAMAAGPDVDAVSWRLRPRARRSRRRRRAARGMRPSG